MGPDGNTPSVRFAASFPVYGVSAHAPMSAEGGEGERAARAAHRYALTGAARAARSFW